MYNIKKYDTLAAAGMKVFAGDNYNISDDVKNPDAVMVHSTMLLDMELNPELKSIVRIGAGVNNIPVDKCTEKGIAVFNCPGGNANAVKELTIAATIMIMRNALESAEWLRGLSPEEREHGKSVEHGKEVFRGPEILGKQIAIIGVGAVGSRMVKSCHDLGMKVVGYDPYLSHTKEQELKQYCTFAETLEGALDGSDVVSIHVPLNEQNRGMIGKEEIEKMVDGVYLVNYARGPILDGEAVSDAIDSGKIRAYATDFPTERQLTQKHVFYTPHMGAGTPEADVNVSVMGARQTKDYLENGNITNSVNLPDVSFARADGARVCIIHKNQVGMLGKITDIVSGKGLNIENLVNKARGEVAYTILDFNTDVPAELEEAISKISGIIRVRVIQ